MQTTVQYADGIPTMIGTAGNDLVNLVAGLAGTQG